jgi:hypothetical protein
MVQNRNATKYKHNAKKDQYMKQKMYKTKQKHNKKFTKIKET